MLNPQEIQSKLEAIIQHLQKLGVTVILDNDGTRNVNIAQLRDQLIVVNTQNRDGLNCLFTIAHLFGHLVQFLNYEKYAHLTTRVEGPKPITVDANFRRAFYEYEVEAFCLGKGLMQDCFNLPHEMDSRYTLFLETDFAHFWHFITTGKSGDIFSFNQMLAKAYEKWDTNHRFLTPLPHPKQIQLNRPALVEVV